MMGIQHIHGVDNHGRVRRILAVGIGTLLDRLDGLFKELTLPPIQASVGPVAVGPLYVDNTMVSSDIREQGTSPGVVCIVRIDEDGELMKRDRATTCHLVRSLQSAVEIVESL